MWKLKAYNRFDWWLNTNVTEAISDNDLIIAENVFYNNAWQLQTRRGYTTFWSQIGSSPITSYFYYQRDDTQDKMAICFSWGTYYYLNAWTRTAISWGDNLMEYETLPGKTTKRARRDYTVFKNVIYMWDWVNPYCSYNWSSLSKIWVSAWVVATADNTTDLFTKVAHWLAVNDELYWTAGTSMPTGLTQYQVYYVSSVPSADTFSISNTPSWTAINFTSDWVWTLTYYKLTEPRVRYLQINQNVCFSAGEDKNPSVLYYSWALSWLTDLTNINTNVVIIWKAEEWIINALNAYALWAVIFKDAKTHYVSLTTTPITNQQIDTQAGWYADRTIETVNNSLTYFNERWIDSLSKRVWVEGAWGIESPPLSAKIRELIDTIEASSYNSSCGQYIKESNNYHFMFDSNWDDIPDTMAVLSAKTGWRTTYTFPEIYDFGMYVNSEGERQYLFASASGWQMYEYDYWFDDNWTAIDATVRTKNFEFQEWLFEFVEIEWRMQEGGEKDLTVYIDDEASGEWTVTDANLVTSSSLALWVRPIWTWVLGWWGIEWLQLYKYKVRIYLHTRWSRISLKLQSTGTQWIFEKMTVNYNQENIEVFASSNIL